LGAEEWVLHAKSLMYARVISDSFLRHMKTYLASSWKNKRQPRIVELLRSLGQEVYDFKLTSNTETHESEVATDLQKYFRNVRAISECDACVLLLPAGMSASWELGYATALGKLTAVMSEDGCSELMMIQSYLVTSEEELRKWIYWVSVQTE
jgi:nucleoside 2-deoxyribosyltransferase